MPSRHPEAARRMTAERSGKILRALRKRYGRPEVPLRCGNLYETAVAVVLSAQTTDAQVNAATPALFARYPDFPSLAGARRQDVERLVKSTGFYRNKARNIIELAKAVTAERGGRLPDSREELMRLPGIGRKSANVILAMGYGRPAFAVDTHVLRVSNRLGYCTTDNPDEAERRITELVPESGWIEGHLLFITHGRALCRARKPLCGECPLRGLCDYARNNP